MLAYADRVRETTTTAGIGAVTLGGAAYGYQSFQSAFGAGPQTVTYTLEGTPAPGTYRLRVEVQYGQVTPDNVNGGYQADSDGNYNRTGTPNTWTAGLGDNHKGLLRGGDTFNTFSFSNVSLGGAPPTGNTFVYPQSEFFQVPLGHVPLQASGSTTLMFLQQMQGGGSVGPNLGSSLSVANEQWSNVGGVGAGSGINNLYPATAVQTQIQITVRTSNLAQSGSRIIPWMHFTTVPPGWTGVIFGDVGTQATRANSPTNLYTIDPHIDFTFLFQLNDSTFGTPPLSKNMPSHTRLPSDLAFLAWRATDAQGNGLNSLQWTEKFWDDKQLISSPSSPAGSLNVTGATQGGQAGWSNAFLGWSNQLPGGQWDWLDTITTSFATGLEGLDAGTMSLLVVNPGFRVIATTTPQTNGDLLVSASIEDVTTGVEVALDSSGPGGLLGLLVVFRYDPTTALMQFWSAPPGPFLALKNATLASPVVGFNMSASVNDPSTAQRTIPAATLAQWGTTELIFKINLYVGGAPYMALYQILPSATLHKTIAGHGVVIRSIG